jgi:hypothetical protein
MDEIKRDPEMADLFATLAVSGQEAEAGNGKVT